MPENTDRPADRAGAARSAGRWPALLRTAARWPVRVRDWYAVRRPDRHPAARNSARGLGMLGVAAVGVALGVVLGGSVTTDLGPFHARLSIAPSVHGGTDVAIPPLGALRLDSHSGPARLRINIEALDEGRARALVADPKGLERAGDTAVEDLDRGVRTLLARAVGAGLLGALLLSALVYRSMRRVATTAGIAFALIAASVGAAVATFRPTSIEEPRYEGLLVNAPAVVGDARRIAGDYEEYRAQLQRLVKNVGRLYGTISSLPVYEPDTTTTRVLHISDMHLNPAAWSVVQTVVKQFSISVVVDTGDITDWGSEPEDSYVRSIEQLKVPYLYVRGNHDSTNTMASVARQPNATVLDNSLVTVGGLTFAGAGDPRFTPDKASEATSETNTYLVGQVGRRLADTIRAANRDVHVALVHDPASADDELASAAPVVLAGHVHRREVRRIGDPTADRADDRNGDRNGDQTRDRNGDQNRDQNGDRRRERTLLMVEGSTGGAGLRGLERDDPLPLALSVLYFDASHVLQAYDDIRVGGTGLSQVSLERHIVAPDDKAGPSPSGSRRSPSPSDSASSTAPASTPITGQSPTAEAGANTSSGE